MTHLSLLPACNHITDKMWYEITYPLPNFKGCTVEVWIVFMTSRTKRNISQNPSHAFEILIFNLKFNFPTYGTVINLGRAYSICAQVIKTCYRSFIQCMLRLLTNELNSLWSSDAIWQQRSGTTLAQVMACCLTAPRRILNQCWLIISKVQWHSHYGNFPRDASTINR